MYSNPRGLEYPPAAKTGGCSVPSAGEPERSGAEKEKAVGHWTVIPAQLKFSRGGRTQQQQALQRRVNELMAQIYLHTTLAALCEQPGSESLLPKLFELLSILSLGPGK